MNIPLIWTCHVCHEERPNANISVFSTMKLISGVSVQTNVRHCNDRPVCIEGAKSIAFLKGAADG